MADAEPHIDFLDSLRALAAWLVVWGHLFSVYPALQGVELPAVAWVQHQVNTPLGITQDFGWFGVCLFFLISGYVITHVARRESPVEFAVKRVFRIFPMLALTVLFAVLLEPGPRLAATPATVLTNVLLVNYWIHPQVVLVGVAWTLAVEVLFYALMLASHPLARWPVLRLLALDAVVALVLVNAREFGADFFLFAASAAYLPYLLCGQVLYLLLHAKAIRPALAAALGAVTYAVMLIGLQDIHTDHLPLDRSYLVSFAWATVLFVLAAAVGDRLRAGRVTRLLAESSYGLYLLHGSVGFALLDAISPRIGLVPALLLAVPVVLAVVLAVHVGFEKPVLKLGRRVARRLARAAPTVGSR